MMGVLTESGYRPNTDGSRISCPLDSVRKQAGSDVIERQRGGWRVFSTIDAAANTAHAIGFKRIEIDLSSR